MPNKKNAVDPFSESNIATTTVEVSVSDVQSHALAAVNLSYWSMEGYLCRRKKMILHDVTCVYKSGVNMILGPSGSGKSTFLELLADRKNRAHCSGQILLNGKPRPAAYKNGVGFVTQDDIMMRSMTVRENIAFSAALRLSTSVSSARRREMVTEIISELGLEKCADTNIGDDFTRGVSGGERKRCNIGMEMVNAPYILFLDEPTSGLDTSTALLVMRLLHHMSESGRVIILSIHQPRYAIYELAETTTMLCKGQLVYFGPSAEILPFFCTQGFLCDKYYNPAEFIIDTCANNAVDSYGLTRADRLINAFTSSEWQDNLDEEIERTTTEARPLSWGSDRAGYPTSCIYQFAIISQRSIKDILHHPQVLLAMICKALVIAGFIGSMFYQLPANNVSVLQDRSGVLFFLTLIQLFFNLTAVDTFIAERKLYLNETFNGYYRASAFFLSKVVNDIIPLRLFPAVILGTTTYYLIGLRPGLYYFLVSLSAQCSVCATAACISFLVGCSVSKVETGHIILNLLTAPSVLFAGLLVNLEFVPWPMAWLQYLSLGKYGYRIAMVNEFSGRTFHIHAANRTILGDDYLKDLSFEPRSHLVDHLPDYAALGAMSLVTLVMAYVQLRRSKTQA